MSASARLVSTLPGLVPGSRYANVVLDTVADADNITIAVRTGETPGAVGLVVLTHAEAGILANELIDALVGAPS